MRRRKKIFRQSESGVSSYCSDEAYTIARESRQTFLIPLKLMIFLWTDQAPATFLMATTIPPVAHKYNHARTSGYETVWDDLKGN